MISLEHYDNVVREKCGRLSLADRATTGFVSMPQFESDYTNMFKDPLFQMEVGAEQMLGISSDKLFNSLKNSTNYSVGDAQFDYDMDKPSHNIFSTVRTYVPRDSAGTSGSISESETPVQRQEQAIEESEEVYNILQSLNSAQLNTLYAKWKDTDEGKAQFGLAKSAFVRNTTLRDPQTKLNYITSSIPAEFIERHLGLRLEEQSPQPIAPSPPESDPPEDPSPLVRSRSTEPSVVEEQVVGDIVVPEHQLPPGPPPGDY